MSMQPPQAGPNHPMGPGHDQAVLTQQGRPTDDSRNAGRVLRLVNTIPASQSQKDGTSHTTIAPGAYGDAPASWSYPIGPSGAYYYWLYPLDPSGTYHYGAYHNGIAPPASYPYPFGPFWPPAALPSNAECAPTFILPPMVHPNVANIPKAFDFHAQVPGFYPTNSGTAQILGQNTSNIQQSFGNMSQTYNPVNVVYPKWPVPDDVNVLVAHEDAENADRNPWLRSPPDFNPVSVESNESVLRATLPAPFLYFITMDMVTKANIIPAMIYRKLRDLRDIRMYQPTRYFTMPDTRQYAQLSSSSDYTDIVTRQYYSRVPRNPCFPDDLKCPRIHPIELLRRLPKHLERYNAAFPQPLPVVIIRLSEIVATIPEVVRWMHGVVYHVVPVLEHQSDCENPEEPEDTLWSMVLKRGISLLNKPYTSAGCEVATFPVQRGNMIYEPEEINFFNYAVNVFIELPRLPGSTLKEPTAMYQGAFILSVLRLPRLAQERWNELTEDQKMDIYNRAPQLFEGLPPFSKCPKFPAVGLYFQNWDMNMLGVLDDLKLETLEDATQDLGDLDQLVGLTVYSG